MQEAYLQEFVVSQEDHAAAQAKLQTYRVRVAALERERRVRPQGCSCQLSCSLQ